MSAVTNPQYMPVEQYLEGELQSDIKHEYIDGYVYAMTGARNAHNVLAGNAFLTLGVQLQGSECRVFNSDVKVRIQLSAGTRFYYPDISVACEQNPLNETFQDNPVVVVEVLSESTRRHDTHEKRDAYLAIPSLRHYILLEQDTVAAVAYSHTETGFESQSYTRLKDVIPLPAINAGLSLAAVYEGVIPENE